MRSVFRPQRWGGGPHAIDLPTPTMGRGPDAIEYPTPTMGSRARCDRPSDPIDGVVDPVRSTVRPRRGRRGPHGIGLSDPIDGVGDPMRSTFRPQRWGRGPHAIDYPTPTMGSRTRCDRLSDPIDGVVNPCDRCFDPKHGAAYPCDRLSDPTIGSRTQAIGFPPAMGRGPPRSVFRPERRGR